MTPEWSRRAGHVLTSPYWDREVVTEEDFQQRMEFLEKEFFPLKEALQADGSSYEKLTPTLRAVFDRAEAADQKQRAEMEEFVKNDGDGYGRFHGTAMYAPESIGPPQNGLKTALETPNGILPPPPIS